MQCCPECGRIIGNSHCWHDGLEEVYPIEMDRVMAEELATDWIEFMQGELDRSIGILEEIQEHWED